MSNRMLIDAAHPEETRVVVLRGNRVEEFDFEAADRQQLRGNIYLAKVTRVEPSLQAAFVDYGGNRHGFLAFSEIHPDYYQIPYADRQALLQQQAREEEQDAAEEQAADDAAAEEAEAEEASLEADAATEPETFAAGADLPPSFASDDSPTAEPPPTADSAKNGDIGESMAAEAPPREAIIEVVPDEPDAVESVGAEDALEEVPERRKPRPRQYKIQEVIKRRQVLLVQVVKEERGSKGAALTTYLSLAGRYSVLMPNTGRGGGISRKITNAADRKRLKAIASDLDVPEGMGVILRTAGANRTKTEVKRDFEYLLRLWENVRELTLRSTAPKLVYEEGSLIKRSIRDLYSREIEQIVVAGDDAYREAKDFMRMLMPSHAKNVQQYRDTVPIFARSGVEAQLDAMFSPQVTLRSGGYIVLNQTEALVSVDVNSGRSTREHSIEDTALNTNMEASEEIARQLRLRDLAGLIVIDFIDMEEKRNNRAVERKLKDCLRADRARIQVGHISHFGLMEMSRQRIRTGVLESSTVSCPHCRGTGQVRSISSLSLQILRALEDSLLRQNSHHLYVRTRPEVALYVLNQKRGHLANLEARFGVSITVTADAPTNSSGFLVERGPPVEERPERASPVALPIMPDETDEEDAELEDEQDAEETAETSSAEPSEGRSRRRRRRRRGNGEDRSDRPAADLRPEEADTEPSLEDEREAEPAPAEANGAKSADEEATPDSRRRRRGRRGGRRRGRGREEGDSAAAATAEASDVGDDPESFDGDEEFTPDDADDDEALSPPDQLAAAAFNTEPLREAVAEQIDGIFGADRPVADESAAEIEAHAARLADSEQVVMAFPDGRSGDPTEAAAGRLEIAPTALPATPEPAPAAEPARMPEPAAMPEVIEDDRPKRSGWWNKRSFF